jgi:hypothetical protein
MAGRHYTVTLQPGTPPHLVVTRVEHGVAVEKHLHREFFNSSEYRRIAELSRALSGLFGRARSCAAATTSRKSRRSVMRSSGCSTKPVAASRYSATRVSEK